MSAFGALACHFAMAVEEAALVPRGPPCTVRPHCGVFARLRPLVFRGHRRLEVGAWQDLGSARTGPLRRRRDSPPQVGSRGAACLRDVGDHGGHRQGLDKGAPSSALTSPLSWDASKREIALTNPWTTVQEGRADSQGTSRNLPKARNRFRFVFFFRVNLTREVERGVRSLIRCSHVPYWEVKCPLLTAGAPSGPPPSPFVVALAVSAGPCFLAGDFGPLPSASCPGSEICCFS